MDLNLMPRADNGVEGAEKITLDLFPRVAGLPKANQHERILEPPERGQLTIFYSEMMFVFDDFPADMVDELAPSTRRGTGSLAWQVTKHRHVLVSHICRLRHRPKQNLYSAVVQRTDDNARVCSEMPIARKSSLKRFLDKRKCRLAAAGLA
ncbi:hypothetical protein ACQ4PT_026115 [Festuca glaucescens]